eukprot:TRINITY_DN5445_c0_g1_i2.p1 TRINITY_DN5445_c0_g1~~TRINITY_DN5445_c0_g1_i2.p1  ORF type:complete len:326 (-),score=54.54 TRINITY_DN5445_c0_g1_i2:725-1702(-)
MRTTVVLILSFVCVFHSLEVCLFTDSATNDEIYNVVRDSFDETTTYNNQQDSISQHRGVLNITYIELYEMAVGNHNLHAVYGWDSEFDGADFIELSRECEVIWADSTVALSDDETRFSFFPDSFELAMGELIFRGVPVVANGGIPLTLSGSDLGYLSFFTPEELDLLKSDNIQGFQTINGLMTWNPSNEDLSGHVLTNNINTTINTDHHHARFLINRYDDVDCRCGYNYTECVLNCANLYEKNGTEVVGWIYIETPSYVVSPLFLSNPTILGTEFVFINHFLIHQKGDNPEYQILNQPEELLLYSNAFDHIEALKKRMTPCLLLC